MLHRHRLSMKRDPRLQGLSSEHHAALVLARTLGRLDDPALWTPDAAQSLRRAVERELEPHFRTEEDVLLTALRTAGAVRLVERVESDHRALRTFAAAATNGDFDAAKAFGERLTAHVRFEERELFPRCEAELSEEVLEAVFRRSPK